MLERVGRRGSCRYGVEPEQVPDFIALRGDPSDKIPGAKGVGPKTAALVLAEHGTLEAALAAGRFEAQAEDLRLYRRIATLDASAPLPSLNDQTPTWAEASDRLRELGMNALASRLAAAGWRRLAMEIVSHSELASLHPTGHHPETPRA